jgi:hypothetical protein
MNETNQPPEEDSNIFLNFTEENDDFVEFEIFRTTEEGGDNEEENEESQQ